MATLSGGLFLVANHVCAQTQTLQKGLQNLGPMTVKLGPQLENGGGKEINLTCLSNRNW